MHIPDTATPDTIILRQKEIKIHACSLPQRSLNFYEENPRIYSSVWLDEDARPTQEAIFDVLSKMDHVRETLVPSIRTNGGLIEPILVRNNVVLEGNSRLAAYRLLARSEPDKWQYIHARVLPHDLSDSEVFSLLGEYHMVGKKDWAPFEQAGYLYRRFNNNQISEQELATEVGLTKSKVQHLISVYGFMVAHDDRDINRWSYYDELLKGRRFDETRKRYPHFDEFIAGKIASEEITRAVDLRDELPKIVKASGNTLKKFMNGSMDFPTAAEDARLRGAGNYHAQKLRTFRQWLAEDTVESDVSMMSDEDIKIVKYELAKINARVAQLVKKLQMR